MYSKKCIIRYDFESYINYPVSKTHILLDRTQIIKFLIKIN